MKAQGNPAGTDTGRQLLLNFLPFDFRPCFNGGYGFFLLGSPSVFLSKGVLHHGFIQPPGAHPGTSARK
jgi:hypothetical protein